MKLNLFFLIFFVVSILFYQSCRKKCADNNSTFSDYNCIQLMYYDSMGHEKNFYPIINEIESNKNLKRLVRNDYAYSSRPKFLGDFLPFDFEHSNNTFVFNDSVNLDTIIIANLNARAVYTNDDCGYQMEVDEPTMIKNTFAKKANCTLGNWNDATNTMVLKIYFK